MYRYDNVQTEDNSLDSCSVCDNLQFNFTLVPDWEVWTIFIEYIFGYKNSPIKIFIKTDVGGWRVWCEEWIIADQ